MLDRDVAEFQRGLHKVALLLVERAGVGHVLYDVVQLVLGDGDLPVPPRMLCGESPDTGQDGGKRGKKAHKKAQRTGGL